ncbi:hypothetical protein CASFOL_021400 [Castilleja foliolosa]|uniref:Uncharacterized protein n=1 Tax=Castilleja foliolosa TaxID=1961234 RepID=A0ABD3CZX2_9LAMI
MSRSTSKQSSPLASPTADESAVAEILIALRKLISLSEYLTDFNWGCKRRRSCLDEVPPLPRGPSSENEIEVRKLKIKAALRKGVDAAGTTASPTTPLAFSPSESDEKSRHKETSKRRLMEDNIVRLTQTRDVFRREVENAKRHYDKLKAYNSELKAMKQKVINNFPIKEEPQNYRINMAPHQQLLITNPTAQQIFQYPIGSIQTRLYSTNDEAPSGDHVGPLLIDLNFPAIEACEEPFDSGNVIAADQRARFAEARRRRRRLMKAKSMRNNGVLKNWQQAGDHENGVL